MKKQDELSNPNSCLNKAVADEPIFVLRAQDRLAPSAIRYWAQQVEEMGGPKEKVAAARALAAEMNAWPTKKMPD